MKSNNRIEVNNIFYDYFMGALWVSMKTAPKDVQWGPVPEWAQVEFIEATPAELIGLNAKSEAVGRAVDKMIRGRVTEQRMRAEGRV